MKSLSYYTSFVLLSLLCFVNCGGKSHLDQNLVAPHKNVVLSKDIQKGLNKFKEMQKLSKSVWKSQSNKKQKLDKETLNSLSQGYGSGNIFTFVEAFNSTDMNDLKEMLQKLQYDLGESKELNKIVVSIVKVLGSLLSLKTDLYELAGIVGNKNPNTLNDEEALKLLLGDIPVSKQGENTTEENKQKMAIMLKNLQKRMEEHPILIPKIKAMGHKKLNAFLDLVKSLDEGLEKLVIAYSEKKAQESNMILRPEHKLATKRWIQKTLKPFKKGLKEMKKALENLKVKPRKEDAAKFRQAIEEMIQRFEQQFQLGEEER